MPKEIDRYKFNGINWKTAELTEEEIDAFCKPFYKLFDKIQADEDERKRKQAVAFPE